MAKESGSRTDTIVKIMLVFFISLLSFSVGTFVGKQVSDSDHRRLALESSAKEGREIASETGGKVSEKDVEALTEEFVNKGGEKTPTENEEVAQEPKGENKDEKKPVAKEEPKVAEKADGYKSYARTEKTEKTEKVEKTEKPEGEAKTDVTHEAAEKVSKNEAPTDGHAEERKPSSTLPGVASSSVGKFTVQVASYATEDEAKGQAGQLKTKGWHAFYIPAVIGGKTWYRVSVGLFNSAESAKAFRKDFVKDTNSSTAIVQKIVQ